MLLAEKIQQDIKTAMKSRQKDVVGALRMLHSGIKNKQIELKRPLEDGEVVRLVQTAIKQRKESATQYAEAGRDDLAASERAEVDVYAAYLPTQLSEDEIERVVAEAVTQVGATGMKDMGAVMKQVLSVCGGQAEGAVVSAMVRAKLG